MSKSREEREDPLRRPIVPRDLAERFAWACDSIIRPTLNEGEDPTPHALRKENPSVAVGNGTQSAEEEADVDLSLAEGAQRVLCILVDNDTNPNNRLSRERIADVMQETTGRDGASGEGLKYSLDTLKKHCLVKAKKSRGGGYWATEEGYRLASRIHRRPTSVQ